MTLAGGPAAKLGHRYETLWTVSECIRLLRGDNTDSIRIEKPGEDKAEFVVRMGQRRELHQVKRSHPNGKWSIATLSSNGLLREIGSKVAGENDRFVFVSGSDARELADLCEAANNTESAEEFAGKFLKSNKDREKSFNGLREKWQCGPQTAIDRLRRISVRTIDERELREKVLWGFQALFLDQPRNLLDATRALVEDSVHRTLRRVEIIEHLRRRGYRLRPQPNPENARLAIQQATDRYLGAARRRLIQQTLVPREAKAALLSRLADTATDSVVLGKAGTGKTAYIVEITEALRSRGWPVLTFRLDRVDFASVPTTASLGQSLNLEESPALVLAAAAEATGCPGVLIVDQLDAVGSASGRSTAAFEMVEALLHEAREQRPRAVIHTVVVCRSFDWHHDHRLRRLLPRDSSEPVTVAEFEIDQVKEVLAAADFDATLFRERQLELLQLPQNLALFLEAGFDQSHVRDFKTAKELFDRYWDEKRRLVRDRTSSELDVHWVDVIGTLCDQMTATQKLFVPRERLDKYPALYVDQMASEGVIVPDGLRYGFGHESFFDYCYARLFFEREEHLVALLRQSEQHLFHRAQVRQILTYLRDADPGRYISELRALLANGGIRTHIKDLALALLAEVAEPTEGEWQIRTQLVGPALSAREAGKANPDRLSDLAWRRLFWSQSWFEITCRHGSVRDWLASGNDALADVAVDYLSWHCRHSPGRALALLEPYVGLGGEWPQRLRVMAKGHYENRSLFEFCLRLIDNGVFDGAPESFTDVFFGLNKEHAKWFSEALARWTRRLMLSGEGSDLLAGGRLWGDDADATLMKDAAKAAPTAFVHHILPIILDISDACAADDTLPKHDSVWRFFFMTGRPSGAGAWLSALADALATTARDDIDGLRDVISTLRERDTHVANHLLLALYGGGAARYADEAASLLCDQPWRLDDDSHWRTAETIAAVVPHCSAESRKRLEDMVLAYVSPYERTKDGVRHRGWSRFGLLSAFAPEMRSPKANAHIKELERKFGAPEREPRPFAGLIVGSPISKDAAPRMTDEQWLRAIDKYDSERRISIDRLKGGAYELAQMLAGRAKEEPERFARLSLKFPAGANTAYLDHTLSALEESDVSIDLKLQVCRKALDNAFEHCGSSIANVLGRIKGPLPNEAVQMLQQLAVESKDPSREEWRRMAGGATSSDIDMHTDGINTTRGRVADAVRDLILTDASHVDRFRATLERMVCDRSPAVLSCVAGTLNAVAYSDADLALSLFKRMDLSEDRLLATRPVAYFLQNRMHDSFAEVCPYIERMLRSAVPDVRQAGGTLSGLAALTRKEAKYLVDEALRGSSHERLGLAHVASANIANPACRAWCAGLLPTLFNDDDGSVRRQAASCFFELKGAALEAYEGLILAFSESRALQEHAYFLLRAVDESLERLPGLTCDVCARLASQPDKERRGLESLTLVKLIFSRIPATSGRRLGVQGPRFDRPSMSQRGPRSSARA